MIFIKFQSGFDDVGHVVFVRASRSVCSAPV